MAIENPARLEPIFPDGWNGEILEALRAFPNALNFVLKVWKEDSEEAPGLRLLASMAHYPKLAKAFLTFNNHVSAESSLTHRDRELIIIRLSWLRQAEYEYLQHELLGRTRAGLTDEEIRRIQTGPDADGWSPVDAALIRAADELHADACITDDTWYLLLEHYSTTQVLDIIFLVGCYDTVAMISKSLKIQPEPRLQPLDPETRANMFE